MPSTQFEAILQLLRANPAPDDVDLAQQRAVEKMMAAQTPLPPDVYTESI